MKFLFQIVKLLFSICLLQGAIANAATEAQINTLIDNLDIQKAIKTQALDLNRYEIEKRSPTQTPKQQEQFKELVAFMEKN